MIYVSGDALLSKCLHDHITQMKALYSQVWQFLVEMTVNSAVLHFNDGIYIWCDKYIDSIWNERLLYI